ncbi:conserved hypothetical protein [Exiguobacterium sp. 8H]|uniref:hypothetical protein n=1 Tax=unclassified Exiguobacterium TaxID=2644629 RepID=UPI0012F38B2E|nr:MULTISPECIES: hypothetical protein [unclassified Exiguobacterium]VXB81708.1 conserved hypothetical protein [Exiguobacterium sp. 8H]VXC00170.1 conserved hypothetical protein [Exiguobacterium sp. 8A]
MLFVRFTDVPDTRIQNYERLTFAEAVVVTHDLHQARSEEGTSCSGDFRLFDQKDELLYRGTFTFGTEGTYPNLYHQVKDRVQRIRTKKEDNAKKMWILDEIESETLEDYKRPSSKSNPIGSSTYQSRLTRLQRRLIYGAATIGILFTSLFTAAQWFIDKEAHAEQVTDVEQIWLDAYEQALQGEESSLIQLFERKDRSDEEDILLVDLYLAEGADEKTLELMDDPILIETKLAGLNLSDQEKLERLQDFQASNPTDEGAFDIATLERDHETVAKTENVEWTAPRVSAKVTAYLFLKDIEAANDWASKTNNSAVQEKVDTYQDITATINELNEKLKKTSSKDTSAREKIQVAIAAEEVKLQTILYSD